MAATWGKVQEKVFTRWANTHLDERDLAITGLLDGSLEDGIMLWNLLEEISGKKLTKIDTHPKMRIHKINNLVTSIKFVEDEGIKLVGIGAENVIDKDVQQVMGLIWTLILRWHVQKKGGNSKAARRELIDWLNSVGIPCTNLDRDWTNGDYISRLVNVLRPNLVHPTGDALDDTEQSIEAALKQFEIPKVVDASDLVSDSPDELVNMTYLSYFRDKYIDAKTLVRVIDSTVPKSSAIGEPFSFQIEFLQGAQRDQLKPKLKAAVLGAQGEEIGTAKIENHPEHFNRCTVSFVPNHSGKQCVDVMLCGVSVQGSPVFLNAGVVPKVTLKVPSHLTGVVGTPVVIPMETENVTPQMLSGSNVVDPSMKPVANAAMKGGGNKYELVFTPLHKGKHLAHVKLDGHDVPGSPVEIQVAAKPTVTAPKDLPDATVNIPYKFHLGAENVKPEDLSVKITDPSGKKLDGVKITPDGNGFNVDFTPREKGKYKVDLGLSGEPVEGAPLYITAKNPPKLELVGPSFRDDAIVDIPYKIQMNSENVLPEQIGLVIRDPKGNVVPSKLTPKGDNGFDIDFTPRVPGHHKVDVKLDGEEVKGSPITVDVKPKPWARIALAGGDGEAFVHEPFEFPVETINVKPDQLSVKIADPTGKNVGDVKVTPMKGKEGYTVNFTPQVPGKFVATVNLDGKPVEGSPVTINAKHRPHVAIRGDKFRNDAIVDDPYKVLLDATNVRPDQLEVIVTDPHGKKVPSKVTPTGPDGFRVDFTPKVPGAHNFAVKLDGDEVEGSPITIVASERPYAKINLAKGGDAMVDVPYVLPIDTVNVKPEQLAVNIKDPNGKPVDIRVEPKKAGNGYDVHFTPRIPGKFVATALLDGQPCDGSPATIIAHPKPAVSIRGPKYRDDAIVDDPYKIIADAVNVKPEQLSLKITDPTGKQIPAKLTPKGDGNQYDIDFTPRVPGKHDVRLNLDGNEVEGCPIVVDVQPRPFAKVNPRGAGDATVNVEYSLPIDTINVKPDQLHVTVTDPNGKKCGDVVIVPPPKGGNTYTAKFTPRVKGKFLANVAVDGGDVEGSPVTIIAKPQPFVKLLKAPTVAVAETPTEFLFAVEGFSPKDFTADIRDVTKFQYPSSAIPVKVDNSQRPKGVDPDVDIISLQFTPREPIKHVAHLFCSGKEVEGSPVTIKVVPKPTIDLLLEDEAGTVGTPFVFQKVVVENVTVEELVVNIFDSQGKLVGTADITDNEDTTFDFVHKFKNTGRYTGEILFNGNHVTKPFSFLVVPAEGRLGVVGELYRLPIRVTNFEPKHLTYKIIHKQSSHVHDPSDVSLVDSAQEDAKYDVVFTPDRDGKYLAELVLQGKPLPGSPVEIEVVHPPKVTLLTPADSDHVRTVDEGQTTSFARISVHSSVNVEILVVPINDHAGQQVGIADIAPRTDGTWDLCFAPKTAGTFVANVKLNGVVVCGPISFTVQIDDS